MKIHINGNEKGLNGYHHIPVSELEKLHEINDSEVLEIFLDDILIYFKLDQLTELFQLIMTKLRHGGILHIVGTDIYEVARNYFTGNIKTQQFNSLLLNGKLSGISLMDAISVMEQLQLKIIKKRLEDMRYCVSGQRL